MKGYLVWIVSLCLLVGSVSALSISVPSNNANITFNTSINFTRSNFSTTVYSYNVYLNNSLIDSISNTAASTYNVAATYVTNYFNFYNDSLNGNRIDNFSIIISPSQYPTCYAYISIIYSNGSITNSSVYSASGIAQTFNFYNPSPYSNISAVRFYAKSSSGAYACGFRYGSNIELSNANVGAIIDWYNVTSTLGLYVLNVSAINYLGNIVDSGASNLRYSTNSLLYFSAFSSGGVPIAGYNLSWVDNVSGKTTNYVGVSNAIPLDVVRGRAYNYSFSDTNYATTSGSVIVLDNYIGTFNVTIQPFNSILFTTINELTGAIITNITTIVMSNSQNSYTNNTNSSGKVYLTNIASGNYSFSTNNTLYSSRTGWFDVVDGSSQNYNIYLSNATAVLLNFKAVGGAAIPNVFVQVFSYVNGSLVVVEQGYTAVDGTFQFGGLNNKYYLINASKDGLASYSFELNPIKYTSYTIPLTAIISGNAQPTAYAIWSPNTFTRDVSTDFSIQFYSPYGSFSNYSYILSYPGGSINGLGNLSYGETLSKSFTIADGTKYNYVYLNMTWYLNDGTSQANSYSYPLIVHLTNRTITTGGSKDYGFLIGDKVFLVAVILLPLMGLAWLAMGFFGSLAIGGISLVILLNSGLFTVNEMNLYIASGVLLVLLLIFRGRQ